MKKIIFSLIILSVVAGLGFILRTKLGVEVPDKLTNLFTNQELNKLVEDENSSLVSLEKTVDVTPDDKYSYGAFCRVNYLSASDNFFVTFGGANQDVQSANPDPATRAGGAEGGNGYSYKIYSKDFEYTGENGIIHEGGGDAASVMADDYYYFLAGAPPNDWRIQKIDPTTWQEVDSVFIDTEGDHEILNDMMLAYANGHLIASGLYDASGAAAGDQKKTNANLGMATHNRIFDLDLNQEGHFILDDVPHINGSYVVFVDGVYNYITSTAYFGDLIVMRYDENWNFLDSKTLDKGAQWSQGAVYDEVTSNFYVAFIDLTLKNGKVAPESPPNIALGIFDKDWNLVEKVAVTNFSLNDNLGPGRPSVILAEGKFYVSYDFSTVSRAANEENFDWQCQVKIYDLVSN